MLRLQTVSFSTMREYLTCAYASKLKRVDKVPSQTTLEMAVGTAVHAAIEHNVGSPMARIIEAFPGQLEGHLPDYLPKQGSKNADWWRATGIHQVAQNLGDQVLTPDGAWKYEPVALERKIAVEMPGLPTVTGIPDGVLRSVETGRMSGHDWKTGTRHASDVIQVKLYGLLWQTAHGERLDDLYVNYLTQHSNRKPGALRVEPLYESDLLVKTLEQYVKAVEADAWPASGLFNNQCRTCNVSKHCDMRQLVMV